MKPKSNKMWLIISVIIIVNIFIFSLLSKNLESFVSEKVADNYSMENI